MVTLCIVVSLPAVSSAGQEQHPGKPHAFEALYTLGAGDKLKVTVFGEPDLSREFQIDGGGSISFPLIGQLLIKGLTIQQVEKRMVEKLKDGYLVDPSVTVEVLNYRPFYILGEVNKPGQYEYVNGITLYNAVAMAGGYTYRARHNQAQITRGNPEVIIDNAEHPTIILPGDIINIRERFF
jgi:polysaccharide export outer membrane protein